MKSNIPINTSEYNIELIEKEYSLETRKKMISNLLEVEDIWMNNKPEKENSFPAKVMVERIHTLLDRIFKSIIKNLDWKESDNLKDWDYRPLVILEDTFPNIKNTQWYNIRQLQVLTKNKGMLHEV